MEATKKQVGLGEECIGHHNDSTVPGIKAEVSESVREEGANLDGILSLQARGALHVIHHQGNSITEDTVILLQQRMKELIPVMQPGNPHEVSQQMHLKNAWWLLHLSPPLLPKKSLPAPNPILTGNVN